MDHLYTLNPDTREPEPFTGSVADWSQLVFGPGKNLAHDPFPCGGFVSTIFMGVDLSGGRRVPPILFETMAFDAEGKAAFQHREHSYWRAMKTHRQVLQHVMEKAAEG